MAAPGKRFVAPDALALWWRAKARRERALLASLAIAAIGIVAWAIAWEPLARDAASLRAERGRNAAALAEARRMADEIASLARTPAPPRRADAATELDRALAQHALRAAATEVAWQDGRARLVFASVPYDALIATLETLQRQAGLRIVEAAFTARVEPRTVRAEVTLAR